MIYGTYLPPKCEVGGKVFCHLEGKPVTVTGFRDNWPLYRPTRRYDYHTTELPILTSELVRAICEEDTKPVMERWGVKLSLMKHWKAAIAGTNENVETVLALKKLEPKFRKRFYPPDQQVVQL